MTADPLAYLSSLEQFGIKFGLDNIRTIVAALGRPDRSFRSFHVAGTNGKGSVTAMVEASLRAAGHRTGRYTSPHLVSVTERFAVDGVPVPLPTLATAIADLQTLVDTLIERGRLEAPPTYFEATTAIAFELFRRTGVQVAVCEVGLGGRLDATNVLEPVATAITSIALDHQQYLGDSVREIAIEKAGIIKTGVPVVVGRLPGDARDAILQVATDRRAPMVDVADTIVSADDAGDGWVRLITPVRDYGRVRIGLAGAHQRGNAAIAVRLLETAADRNIDVPAAAIIEGLASVSWPGRLDIRRMSNGREILLDAAHNPAGAEALAAFLRTGGWGGLPLVFAAMSDKDASGMLSTLIPVSSVLVATRASNPRSVDPRELANRALALNPALTVHVSPSVPDALKAAWSLSPRIVAAGSIFLLGDVLKEIGGA